MKQVRTETVLALKLESQLVRQPLRRFGRQIRETALREDAIFAGIQNLGLLAGNENFDIITVKMNLNHCVP